MHRNEDLTDNIPEYLAGLLRVMAHPERLKMLLLLRKSKSKGITVTALHHELKLTQPETSRHLTILKNQGILKSRKEGSNVFYSIEEKNQIITRLFKCLQSIFEK